MADGDPDKDKGGSFLMAVVSKRQIVLWACFTVKDNKDNNISGHISLRCYISSGIDAQIMANSDIGALV